MAPLARSLAILLIATSLAQGQTTERASLGTNGEQAYEQSRQPQISADGRFVAFSTGAANLVPGDTNGVWDVFLRDRRRRTTERVSVSSAGEAADDHCLVVSMSADARFVAFLSMATNLVPGDAGWPHDCFVRDRATGTTEKVSVDSAGADAWSDTEGASLSADGRFVAFWSWAGNLVPGDHNPYPDVFVRDRILGTTERASVSSSGVEADGECNRCAISADGRFVVFVSSASTLAAGDVNGWSDVFVRDRLLGTTELASLSTSGIQGDFGSSIPAISGDGRYVAFSSDARNLVPGDTNGSSDVFVRDRLLGTLERVSVTTGGGQANHASDLALAISPDGRYVSFESSAWNLVPEDTNGGADVFVRDRVRGTTERVSVATGGAEAYQSSTFGCPLSADGRFVAFDSISIDLVAGDSNGVFDIFVHDRDTSVLVLLCEPSVAGVTACPCANPAAGVGRGCDNSSRSGGATIAAEGSASLSTDDVVFTTGGEPPGVLSVLVQGDAFVLEGAVYGHGIRCVGGAQLRLFTKTAAGGGVTVPDFTGGDPTISARSAAKGDAIVAGESRWYLVYYRDPVVLGGCPASSTFNATPTRQATWAP